MNVALGKQSEDFSAIRSLLITDHVKSCLLAQSWHPLLYSNQERVWKKEKEALEERKKLEELRRERQQEREMQELQRLQEAAGGKKRVDKLDWMYATPATQGGPAASELEDYLLGKKRVDKLLKGDEAAKVSKSDQSSFISVQNANTSKDLAAKIREDPMLAIKQQEQAAYEALMRDPSRLRQLRAQAGLSPDRHKESKEERRRRKEEKRRRKEEKYDRRRDSSSKGLKEDGQDQKGYLRYGDHRSPSPGPSSRIERLDRSGRGDGRRSPTRFGADEEQAQYHRITEERKVGQRRRSRSRSPLRHHSRRFGPEEDYRDRRRTRQSRDVELQSNRASYYERPKEREVDAQDDEAEERRKIQLEEMMSNARDLTSKREELVSRVNALEKVELEREEKLREKLLQRQGKGMSDGKGTFLLDQQRKVFGEGVDLAERIRRGRGGLQRLD
ncbi:hypothetical protein IE53DRAFT_49511 [Violaceomyces palustris]|uniref:Uncharacterized protein n=1 Tax=Violaceomyces palustris TaxID=1673888 RepID=A0ACD0P7I8_9BASI|nr:hypothetical protein IE53DRAFT_49511 [Violaceomyces palustris]